MDIWIVRLKWMIAAIFCLTVAGCIGSQSEPARFFMLDSVAPASVSSPRVPDETSIRISLEPVEIPEYLNRPQIVTHLDRSEYQLDEFNRWMEPLSDNLTRVIGENLSEMLGAKGIDIFSMSRPMDADFNIVVQILRLDGTPGQNMVLVARWSLFDQTGNALLLTKRSVFKEAISGKSYHGFVEVQNRLIVSLSRDIADNIRPMVTPRTGG